MIIHNDNLQIIKLLILEIVEIDTKLRHIDIVQCWLRKSIQRDILNVFYLSTAQMIADDMTKLLPSQKHKEFIKQLGLVNTEHLIEMIDAKSPNWGANWGSKLCEHRVSSYSRSGISIRKSVFEPRCLFRLRRFAHQSDCFGTISTPFSELISVGFQLIQPLNDHNE